MLIHHHRKVDIDLVRDLTIQSGDTQEAWGFPVASPEWMEKKKAALEQSEWLGGLGLSYARDPTLELGRPFTVSVTVRQAARWWIGNRRVHFPLFEREGWNWLRMSASKSPDHRVAEEMEWFLEKARSVFPTVKPDFALADRQENIVKHLGEDPQGLAWPVLYYGPQLVASHGRDAVMGAPAWRVEEFADGGVWIQVLQNPFLARKADLVPLAKHLGLQVPRGNAN